jgi:hypothetical protein
MIVQLMDSLKSMKHQLRLLHDLIDVASRPPVSSDDSVSEYHVVEEVGALQASLTLAKRKLSVLLDRRNGTLPVGSVPSGVNIAQYDGNSTSPSQRVRHATVEESTEAEYAGHPSEATPQPEDFASEFLPTPSNTQPVKAEATFRNTSKRPRASDSSDTAVIVGKRRHDGNGSLPPWPKKSKETHTISHFGEEAEFLPEPQFYDLTEEVDRRLKLREVMKEKEKARLADKSKKRRKSSTDADADLTSVLFKSVVTDTVQVSKPRKRMRTGSTQSNDEHV